MADKLPAMPVYAGDWFKDRALRMCQPATRGIWFDLLLSMWTDDRCGMVTGTMRQLASIAGCTEEEMAAAVADLEDTETATVTRRNTKVTLTNRRMRAEYLKRKSTAERQRKFREKADPPEDGPGERNKDVTTPISISVSISPSGEASASCSEPAPASPEPPPSEPPPDLLADDPPVLEFACSGKTPRWVLRQSHVDDWSEAYPGLDVIGHCRRALSWIRSNPTRRKTANGMPRFLNSWLEREANRGGPRGGHGGSSARPQTIDSVNAYLGENR